MRKRFLDRRYRRTDRRILKAIGRYVKENPYTIDIGVKQLAKESGVHSTTVYRHYRKGASGALFLYGRRVLANFRRQLKKMQENGASFMDLVYFLVRFIFKNCDFFEMSFCCGDKRVFEKMMQEIETEMMDFAHITMDEMQRIKEIYYCEIYGVLDGWRKDGFEEEEMGQVIYNIMFLTQHVRERLGGIN